MTSPIELRCLIVDDIDTNRAVMEKQIAIASKACKLPCVCDFAENGLEAVALCAQHEYDLIIMDNNMPEMNGPEAAREILALSPRYIIGYTATESQEEIDACKSAGMEEVLPKNPGQLREAVQQFMRKQSL